jgi:hypothetical protein
MENKKRPRIKRTINKPILVISVSPSIKPIN